MNADAQPPPRPDLALLENLIDECKDLPEDQLYAGLAVLAKSTAEHLDRNPRPDARNFRDLYADLLRDEAPYEIQGSPFFKPLAAARLPEGYAEAADAGNPHVAGLGDPAIVHEYTVNPGRALFEKFKAKFKEVVCGKDGPYEKFQNGLVGQAELPLAIAAAVLASGIGIATLWYPLAVYFALLLVKTGLKTYCEP